MLRRPENSPIPQSISAYLFIDDWPGLRAFFGENLEVKESQEAIS